MLNLDEYKIVSVPAFPIELILENRAGEQKVLKVDLADLVRAIVAKEIKSLVPMISENNDIRLF